ncbi:hypothetical protein BDV98DRAFT_573337 [Pterulicium gracile]|uniref:NmrA-like domain-containing protein n=1 Tax=Pterulicium gracile TaxID=1884261 RepID=A0A5C3Q859_9AGAR|nr:hypothetical protein BDV98DRAFT_573337 [Pterula gracilis]
MSRTTIAIAGAGDLAKHLVEELLASSSSYDIVVLTTGPRPWFNRPNVTLHIVTYTLPSILSVLNSTRASVLFSFLNHEDPAAFVTANKALLDAARASTHTKRFVPSEYSGDIDRLPDIPRYYVPSRGAFRTILAAQTEVEYTLIGIGWIADHFVPKERRHMRDITSVAVWPIDLEKWEWFRIGTGDERVTFTAARDVARGLVRLVEMTPGSWPPKVYMEGETTSWNRAVETLEKHYGKPLTRLQNDRAARAQSYDVILKVIEENSHDETSIALLEAYFDEASVSEGTACPADLVARQKEELFQGIKFRSIDELLKDSERLDKI